MPLLKLWNSLRGRSKRKQPVAPQDCSEPSAAIVKPVIAETANAGTAPRTKPTSRAKTSTGFSLFGGGPHASLCKLVKHVQATSVLEISVEDGSRAVAVHKTLAKSGHDVQYFGIDQFELAGPVSLKEFHQTLRAEGIRPQLFPGSIERGLIRFAYTIGTVDLVLVAEPEENWRNPTVLSLLDRISHPQTVVLTLQDETWQRFSTQPVSSLRRAA